MIGANPLSSQLKQFHSRILRTWVQGLAVEDEYHKRDKKRVAGDVKDAPAAKKHSNSPPSAEALRRRSACFESLLLDRCSRRAFGSESTLYMVYFITVMETLGGWNPLWKIIGGNLSGL